jgi:diaminopimelate epimerase
VFARYLERSGLVDPDAPLLVDTRGGTKRVTFCANGDISVEMGTPKVLHTTCVTAAETRYRAWAVDVGNPHAVAVVESLDAVGELRVAPEYSADDFPEGVNIEFVEVRGDHRLAMRVYERGVGETASCGTGAVAATAAVAAHLDQVTSAPYRIDVGGGALTVSLDSDGTAHLRGPAMLVAEGTWTG